MSFKDYVSSLLQLWAMNFGGAFKNGCSGFQIIDTLRSELKITQPFQHSMWRNCNGCDPLQSIGAVGQPIGMLVQL